MVPKKTSTATCTVPALSLKNGHQVAATLQGRLHALNDLQLTVKDAHWNGPARDSRYNGVISSHRDAIAAARNHPALHMHFPFKEEHGFHRLDRWV